MIGRATSRASLRSAGFSDRAIGARPPKQSERSCSRVKKKTSIRLPFGVAVPSIPERPRTNPSSPPNNPSGSEQSRSAPRCPDRPECSRAAPSPSNSERIHATPSGIERGPLHPVPCRLHPAPCTLHPAPCTLHPAPCTLHPPPLHLAPCTLHPAPCCTMLPAPLSLLPAPLHPCTPAHPDLKQGPADLQSAALTTELSQARAAAQLRPQWCASISSWGCFCAGVVAGNLAGCSGN